MQTTWKRTENGQKLEGTGYTVENRDEQRRTGYWDIFVDGEWDFRFDTMKEAKAMAEGLVK